MTETPTRERPAVLRLCATCTPRPEGATETELATALQRAGLGDLVEVRSQSCLSCCDAPVALALQGPGRASYVFAGVDPARDIDDLAATIRLFLNAPAGWIEDARPCGALRHRLRARIAAL